jgi:hypothetical protein
LPFFVSPAAAIEHGPTGKIRKKWINGLVDEWGERRSFVTFAVRNIHGSFHQSNNPLIH